MAKILVVDDSEAQRAQLKIDLEKAGYTVVEGANGSLGFDKLMENPDVGLVICDVNMPVMDGLTMCSKIHQTGKFPTLPIFMLTSEASADMKQKAKEFGVRAWIMKPFVAEKLIAAAGKVINK